jgi:beta-lactamase class A
MKQWSPNRFAVPILVAVLMALSFAAGYSIHFVPVPSKPHHTQIRLERYRYISPLLECEVSSHGAASRHPDLKPFREAITRVSEARIADHSAGSIAVYLRELNSGLTFGREEQKMIAPGSLMKVPLMIAILKRAELDPALLRKTLLFDEGKAPGLPQHFDPPETLRHGSSYTVDDLLFRMIAYSDNNATQLLSGHFGMDSVDDALRELDVPVDTSGPSDMISLRNYSAFFRVLYNATYLTHAMSEKALDLLARSTFTQGIRAGVPRGIAVVNKFGESNTGEYALQEFAIVYYPEHPYLLGIAAKGADPDALARALGEISRAVYQEMDRQHRTSS